MKARERMKLETMICDPENMPREDIKEEVKNLKVGDIVAFYCSFPMNLRWQRQEKEGEICEVSRHIIRGLKKNKIETTLLYVNPMRKTVVYMPGDNYDILRSVFLKRTWKKL